MTHNNPNSSEKSISIEKGLTNQQPSIIPEGSREIRGMQLNQPSSPPIQTTTNNNDSNEKK